MLNFTMGTHFDMQSTQGSKLIEKIKHYAENEESYRFEIWIGLLIVALVFGLIGNLFGVVSITLAKSKQTLHFHKFWNSTAIYFFNLLVLDLFYCLFLISKLIHAAFIFLKLNDDDTNEMECRFFVLGAQTLGNIGGWSVMSIVFTQAIPKIR